MRYLLLLVILLLQWTGYSQSSDKKDLIYELLEVQGSKKAFEVVIDNMITLQKQSFHFLDDEYWDKATAEFKKDDFKELFSLLAPIYDKHLSEAEIAEILRFFKSPTGQKLVEKQPLILQESMKAGESWGREIGIKIYKHVQESDEFKFNTPVNECDDFKTGTFSSLLSDGSEAIIERKATTQIETFRDKRLEYEIEWVDNCKYKIKDQIAPEYVKCKEMLISIYEIDSLSCKTIARFDDDNTYHKVVLTKIK